jgi:4-carboxymuconolactone decarboxylase
MQARREVLGDEHVAKVTAATTALDRDFQRWLTETAWGGVWARPGLDRRTRSLITIAILAALGHNELALHLGAAGNTGATPEDVAEVLLHVAVYAGIPAANAAFGTAKGVYEGDDDD